MGHRPVYLNDIWIYLPFGLDDIGCLLVYFAGSVSVLYLAALNRAVLDSDFRVWILPKFWILHATNLTMPTRAGGYVCCLLCRK